MKESARPSQLIFKLRNFALSKVGFWSDKVYDISSAPSRYGVVLKGNSNSRKWIVIVSREHYHESVTDYPIADARDLRSVLRLEPRLSPYRGHRFNQIERLSTESHRVTSWIVKESVISSLKVRPLWLIPETACLYPLSENCPLSLSRHGESVLAVSSKNGLKSGLESSNIARGAAERWRSRFLAESGCAGDASVEQLTEEQTGWRYLTGIWRILVNSPLTFKLPIERPFGDNYPWAKLASTSLAVGFVYILLTSIYLVGASAWVDYRLGVESDSSQVALSELRQGDGLQKRLDEITELFHGISPSWIIWDVVLDLVKVGVKVNRVDGASGEITIYGTAAKATEVLRFLNEDSRVESVEFKVPVRQLQDRQQFGVSFELSPLTSYEGQGQVQQRVSTRDSDE